MCLILTGYIPCNPSTWEVETGESKVQGHSWVHSKFRLGKWDPVITTNFLSIRDIRWPVERELQGP